MNEHFSRLPHSLALLEQPRRRSSFGPTEPRVWPFARILRVAERPLAPLLLGVARYNLAEVYSGNIPVFNYHSLHVQLTEGLTQISRGLIVANS
jgi:hypothetical protein